MGMNHIIHQSWKTNELNEKEGEWVVSVKKAFEGYEYKFWTDKDNDDLVRISYSEFYNYYKDLLPIEKADFARHLYIYHYGGVYLDLDVRMNKPLPLEGAEVFLCDQTVEANDENMKILVDPFFLAGNEGCKFFYSMCQAVTRGTIFNILSSKTSKEYLTTLYKTGPYMLTKFYLLNKHKYNIKLLKDVFTTERFGNNVVKEQAFGVHIQFNSWLREEDRRKP
jgi:hypothetical protein